MGRRWKTRSSDTASASAVTGLEAGKMTWEERFRTLVAQSDDNLAELAIQTRGESGLGGGEVR
jgi:hypothetical protein